MLNRVRVRKARDLQRKSLAVLRNTREGDWVVCRNCLEDLSFRIKDTRYLATRREYAIIAEKLWPAAAISMKDQVLALVIGQRDKTLLFGIVLNPPRAIAHHRLRTHTCSDYWAICQRCRRKRTRVNQFQPLTRRIPDRRAIRRDVLDISLLVSTCVVVETPVVFPI